MTDKLSLGLSLTLIGVLIVFFILLVLQVLMNVEAYVFNRSRLNKQKNEANNVPNNSLIEHNNTANALDQAIVAKESQSTISPQVIAAIMGAIALCTGQPAQRFRLVSIRQTWDQEASAAWSLNNRMDVINRRNSFYSKGGIK